MRDGRGDNAEVSPNRNRFQTGSHWTQGHELVNAEAIHNVRGALRRLDLRLRLTVDRQRDVMEARARDPFRGLYLTDADVDAILATMTPESVVSTHFSEPLGASWPRFAQLAQAFGLDTLEQEILLITLAPEIDIRYERLYGYLHDDTTRRRPSIDLVARLLAGSLDEEVVVRGALGTGARLLRLGLIVPIEETGTPSTVLARMVRPDDRVVSFLLGSDRIDPRLAGIARLVPSGDASVADGALAVAYGAEVDQLARLVAHPPPGPPQDVPGLRLIYLRGGPGSPRTAIAEAACRQAGRPLLMTDIAALMASDRANDLLPLLLLESCLNDAVLGMHGADRFLAEDTQATTLRRNLRRLLPDHPRPVIMTGEGRWEPSTWIQDAVALSVTIASPGPAARIALWQARLGAHLPQTAIEELGARYRMEPELLDAVASTARALAIRDGRDPPDHRDFRAAARVLAAPPLDGSARRIETRYTLADIVLSPDSTAQLREILARIRHQAIVLERWGFGKKHARQSGVSVLFAGPPGTGKTMAAEVIAGELGLELFRIDLSAVVSKYIGETEKNLEVVFRAADRGDAVLLFDEADALFGKRSEVKDAHDRHANVEIAYLLQRLESYEGLAILTTNLRGNIDEAFLRRLDHILEFPLPEEAERLQIWERALPADVPLGPDIDLPFLARKFKLSGGHIKNIALTGAFLAAAAGSSVGMAHLVRATRREHQKLGKLASERDFEHFFPLLQDE